MKCVFVWCVCVCVRVCVRACILHTGAKLYERAGFIDAEHLLEDLVPFMDHGPKVHAHTHTHDT